MYNVYIYKILKSKNTKIKKSKIQFLKNQKTKKLKFQKSKNPVFQNSKNQKSKNSKNVLLFFLYQFIKYKLAYYCNYMSIHIIKIIL
jgi:hypothetical protein